MLADALAEMFDSVYHIKNYYINFGGDIRAKGNNGNDSYWPISIEKPMFNTLKSIEFCKIPLKNYSLATENSYKNFFFYKGKRFSQNLNPLTGFPERNELLSATILAKNATEAKALAATCMIMGLNKSIEFIEKNQALKAFLIFEKDNQIQYWSSSNLSATISKQE
jgi:thiamine biosynthesis lipoprotein